MPKGRKNKEVEKDISDEEMDSLDEEQQKKPVLKKGNKDKKVSQISTSEDESEPEEKVEVKKSAFALLMDDSDNSDDDDKDSFEEEEIIIKKKETKKNNKKKVEEMDVVPSTNPEPAKGGKKKKKRKKDEDEEEDIEKVLAELKLEYDGKKPSDAAANEDSKDKTKKEKKQKAKNQEEDEDNAKYVEVIDGMEVGGTVKTAAQKKKEKKERQKQKLAEQKKMGPKKGKEQDQPAELEVPEKQDIVEEPAEDPDPEDGDGRKKKKKKEDEKKKGKKPGKGTLAAMQEALKKVQEEQEKAQKEEEERIRKEEEAEAARLEQKRILEERKALKKQREKEKKEQLKKEGKYLTAKQKQEKARAEAMLEAMRAQGMEIPSTGEKKLRPGTRIRPKKEKSKSPDEPKPAEPEVKQPQVEELKVEETAEEEQVKDDWEDEDDGVKESWDAESDKEEAEEKSENIQGKEEASESGDGNSEETSEEESSDNETDDSIDEDSDSDEDGNEAALRRERALTRIQTRRAENEKKRSIDNLRAPVVCVLGHVDTGKTKILDKLRRTNVQDGEAGGITQQIGATNVPIEEIEKQCKMVKNFNCNKLPGLLIIDTPGHESFSNLRDRGSSLCDIAILVVDIMHGLEPQTIESINLLKKKKTPFVIALNKIDRLYEWRSNRHIDVRDLLESQQQNTKFEFKRRSQEVITAMAEQGLNAALFFENPDPDDYCSMVPTSAHSGDGMGNLMGLLVELSQTRLARRLAFSEELQATVLEVKAIPGLGTTIDVVLVNGTLKEGQNIIVAGTEGPIVTPIKALLTPSKMQDLRVKNTYREHKELRAAQGVKICAKDLEKAIAGLNCLVAYHPDEVELCKEEMERALESALNAIKVKERGVFVQASTLGSLEALIEFLRTSKIPYAGVKIGPVVKRDVMKASVMLEHEEKYTVILAFDVKVEREAQDLADSMGVKIFQADIIYHLFDRFIAYQDELQQKKREEFKHQAVFPCKLRVMPNFVFNSRDPIVAGVQIEAGIIRQGTPLCVPSRDFLQVGVCTSIQKNHNEVEMARKGEEVCIKIEPVPGEAPKMFGRHFDEKDLLVSKISRTTIDVCKQYFRDDLQRTDWQLMVELKKIFQIL